MHVEKEIILIVLFNHVDIRITILTTVQRSDHYLLSINLTTRFD